MIFTVRVLGIEVLHLELADSDEDDKARDLSGGDTGSTQIGFVARMDVPQSIEVPER